MNFSTLWIPAEAASLTSFSSIFAAKLSTKPIISSTAMEKIGRQVVQTREKLFISIEMLVVEKKRRFESRVELKQGIGYLSISLLFVCSQTDEPLISLHVAQNIELNGDRESNDGRRVKRLWLAVGSLTGESEKGEAFNWRQWGRVDLLQLLMPKSLSEVVGLVWPNGKTERKRMTLWDTRSSSLTTHTLEHLCQTLNLKSHPWLTIIKMNMPLIKQILAFYFFLARFHNILKNKSSSEKYIIGRTSKYSKNYV